MTMLACDHRNSPLNVCRLFYFPPSRREAKKIACLGGNEFKSARGHSATSNLHGLTSASPPITATFGARQYLPRANSGLGDRASYVLATCLLQTQYGECLLRPIACLPQGDFRPAETHRNPSGDQLQHELAGVTTIIRQVIGKLDAGAPLFCHHPHFKWRRACRKAVPVHRQPVPFGEVEEHCRIAARGDDPPGRGIGLEPMLFKILLPRHALHAILSIEDKACSTVGIEHGRRGSQLLEPTSGFLAARAIAGARSESAARLPRISPCRIGTSRRCLCCFWFTAPSHSRGPFIR